MKDQIDINWSNLLLVVSLLLVAMPFAPSSVLAPWISVTACNLYLQSQVQARNTDLSLED